MGETNIESPSRKMRAECLLQPVTRFVAAMVLTVVNGKLELRPEPKSVSISQPALR
jgi:hypothetical protein